MAAEARVPVEVVYALAEAQVVVPLELPVGSTAADALERSGLTTRFPEIAQGAKIGVYGRIVTPDTRLAPGDRVEIYRPLIADPKQARRLRAEVRTPPKR